MQIPPGWSNLACISPITRPGTARLCGDDVTEYECVTGDDRHHDPNGLVVGGVTGAAVLGDGCREQVRPSMKLGMNLSLIHI